MKKIKILLLAGVLCLSVTACKQEEKADGDETIQEDTETQKDGDNADIEISVSDSEKGESQSSGQESHILYTEDKQTSIQVKSPAGYQPQEYSTDTWLNLEMAGGNEQNSSQIIMTLVDKSMEETAEMMKQEVQYTSSANATGDVTIEEIQTKEEGDRQVSYFLYSYMTDEIGTHGCRGWTRLENGCTFTCTIESRGTNVDSLDMENMLHDMITSIQE